MIYRNVLSGGCLPSTDQNSGAFSINVSWESSLSKLNYLIDYNIDILLNSNFCLEKNANSKKKKKMKSSFFCKKKISGKAKGGGGAKSVKSSRRIGIDNNGLI